MTGTGRLANEAWESMFRAQVVVGRELAAQDTWDELPRGDYDVLYTLAKASEGLRMTEINRQVMLTQPGISRLVSRLEEHGLVERRPDPNDARAQRVRLTEAGRDLQRRVGRRHVRHVIRAMTRALDPDQLRQLRELCAALTAAVEAASPRAEKGQQTS